MKKQSNLYLYLSVFFLVLNVATLGYYHYFDNCDTMRINSMEQVLEQKDNVSEINNKYLAGYTRAELERMLNSTEARANPSADLSDGVDLPDCYRERQEDHDQVPIYYVP